MKLKLKRLENNDLPIPTIGSEHAAAVDFQLCLKRPHYLLENFRDGEVVRPTMKRDRVERVGNFVLYPGEIVVTSLGFAADLESQKIRLLPRSSMSNHILMLANTEGLIDSDYRGELFAALYNAGRNPIAFEHGDKVIQGELDKSEPIRCVEEITELSQTLRGEGGFGSTDRA